jgi:hypothetical protein
MNQRLREILNKMDGSTVLSVKIAPKLEIEDKEGIPYSTEGDNLVFIHKSHKYVLPIPRDLLIGEYPGGNELLGDAQGLSLHTPDFSVNASIEYSYGKTQEYYQKQRQKEKSKNL